MDLNKFTDLIMKVSSGKNYNELREIDYYCNDENYNKLNKEILDQTKDSASCINYDKRKEVIESEYQSYSFINGIMINIIKDEDYDIPLLLVKITEKVNK